MALKQVDQLQQPAGNESDFKNDPNFQAAVKQYGEAKATEAYKKAQEIALSELAANQERPEASGQLVEKNYEFDDVVVPQELGAKKPTILEGTSVGNESGLSEVEKRVSELAGSFLSDNRKIDRNTSDAFELTKILNGGPEAQETLKKYLENSKN